MAHLIESMAYAKSGGVPWHNLGVPVSSDMTPEEIAIASGIDWPVEKQPVYQYFSGDYRKVEGRWNLTRTTDGNVLDIVGDIYKPTQNIDALAFFKRFTQAGDMSMETAGSLDKGRRIWGLAKISDGFTLAGGDEVKGYLLLCSPHKQGEAFTVKLTSIRVVCNNTLTAALNGGGGWRMSHIYAFNQSMKDAAAEALGLARVKFETFQQNAELLSTTRVENSQALIEYVARLSGSKLLDSVVDETNNEAAAVDDGGSVLDSILAATVSQRETRAIRETDLNRVGRTLLDSILDSPGSDLPSARGTWWGAVNGVTHAVDHVIGRSDDSRMTSAWFGQRANLKQAAVDLAVKYASATVN